MRSTLVRWLYTIAAVGALAFALLRWWPHAPLAQRVPQSTAIW